jgi:dTDP-4-dehydrorhamnose 3,5-epimerase
LQVINTEIPGLILIEPKVFPDPRGYFFESFHLERFRETGISAEFVQDNESMSVKDVLRGLHFQYPPYSQGKLVRVVRGSVQDVAVDLRQGSPAFGKWHSAILSSDNKLMMWIPEGFAHGFMTLEDNTIFQYKCTRFYHPGSETTILWNDPDLAIDWKTGHPIVSDKDTQGIRFKDLISPFHFTTR